MTNLSTSREQSILNDIASGGVYVSLHSADEGNEPDGSDELTASDYSRQHVPESELSINGSNPATLTNDNEIQFGVTNTDWGTISHGALWSHDAGVSGEEPYTSTIELANGGAAPSGVEVKINAGDLTLSLD